MGESKISDCCRIVIMGASGRLGTMALTGFEMLKCRTSLDLSMQFRSAIPATIGANGWFNWSFDAQRAEDNLVTHLEGADVVLNLSGTTPTTGYSLAATQTEDDFMEANVDLVMTVLTAAHRAGVPRVLLASSASVYGPQGGQDLILETAPLNPVNAYGRSKAAMEQRVLTAHAAQDVEICCLRIGNIAGADMLLQNAITSTHSSPLYLDQFRDGRGPKRSYIGPLAFAETLETLCRTPQALPRVLNLASPTMTSMDCLLKALSDLDGPVHWHYRNAAPWALERVILDVSRLGELHEARVESPLEMVRDALPFLRTNVGPQA